MPELISMLCILTIFIAGIWIGNEGAVRVVEPKFILEAVNLCEANGGLQEVRVGSQITRAICSNGANFELERK